MADAGVALQVSGSPATARLTANCCSCRCAARLDAYRQAFEAFIHSFTTYRPLLLRIKAQYDAALDDALESMQENIHMRCGGRPVVPTISHCCRYHNTLMIAE